MSLPTFLVSLAVMVQVVMTLVLVWYLGFIRVPMVTRGEVNVRDIALDRSKWPERERKISNALDNQFQLPVLFYIAAMAAVYMGADVVDVVLAWGFVTARIVHLAVHITDNHVIRRFWAYTVGLTILSIFWIVLIARFLVAALAFGLH